jgi:hypothetical protein
LNIAIPKRFGETITLDDLTYINGVEINDVLVTQDGVEYIVNAKKRRGYGAYYVLELHLFKGQENSWIAGQYHRES